MQGMVHWLAVLLAAFFALPIGAQVFSNEYAHLVQELMLPHAPMARIPYAQNFLSKHANVDFSRVFHEYISPKLESKESSCSSLSNSVLKDVQPACAASMRMFMCGLEWLIGNFTTSCQNGTEINETCKAIRSEAMDNHVWTAYVFDSMGKRPSGLEMGYSLWLGSYEECRNVSVPHVYEPQYCILQLGNKPTKVSNFESFCQTRVPNTDTSCQSVTSTPYSWGVCMPKTCSSDDIRVIAQNCLLDNKTNCATYLGIQQEYCVGPTVRCEKTDTLDGGGTVFMLLFISFWGIVMLAATLFDLFYYDIMTSSLMSKEGLDEDVQTDETSQRNGTNLSRRTSSIFTPKGLNREEFYDNLNMWFKALLAFSIYTNGKKLLDVNRKPDQFSCLHGIRFLTIAWVILGHTYFFIPGFVDNTVEFTKLPQQISFMVVDNATVAVDTFFLLSGLLVAYLFLKEMRDTKGVNLTSVRFWIVHYVHRFIRLTPLYLFLIVFVATLWPHMGSGPLWDPESSAAKAFSAANCQNNWWANLLYLNNFVNLDNQCIGWTWYLATDMQFYIFAPLILVPLWIYPIVGFVASLITIAASALAEALYVTSADDPPTAMFTTDFSATYITSLTHFYKNVYVKPYMRCAPYIIGMLLGYILLHWDKLRLKRMIVTFLWCVSTVICLAVLFGLFSYASGSPLNSTVNGFYASMNRVAWAVGIAIVIILCLKGFGGIADFILSWQIWIPLSRLTYSIYLVHPLVIGYFYMTIQQPLYLKGWNMFYLFLAHTLTSILVAIVVSLAFEAPCLALEKLLLRSRIRKQVAAHKGEVTPNGVNLEIRNT